MKGYYQKNNINKMLEIEKLKRLETKINDVMPNMYASFAIALIEEYKWNEQDVADLFAITGELWRICSEKKMSMRQWCLDLTGIDVEGMVNEKAVAGGGTNFDRMRKEENDGENDL